VPDPGDAGTPDAASTPDAGAQTDASTPVTDGSAGDAATPPGGGSKGGGCGCRTGEGAPGAAIPLLAASLVVLMFRRVGRRARRERSAR
jgi:hypothetical protein